jgi:anti-anti-sigma factor
VADTFVHSGADAEQVWYTIDDSGACVVLTVGGRVDAQTCPGVCDAVLVASGFSSGLVVDLSKAEFADGATAGLFVRALQQSRSAAYAACVVAPPEPVGRLLSVSGAAAGVSVRTSVSEAAAALPGATRGPLPL